MATEVQQPKYRHFTIDGSKQVEDDTEKIGPAVSMDSEDAERVKALRERAREVHESEVKQREADQRKRDEDRAEGKLPKPSELLAQREGRSAESKADEKSGKQSSSKS